MKNINIIGAGLSGSLMAVLLAQKGFEVAVYERRPDRRKEWVEAGRSINLAMSARGMNALKSAGILDDIMKIAIPMKGRMVHAQNGALTFIPYSKNPDHAIYSVSRGTLNEELMTQAEKFGAKIHFKQRCESMDIASETLTFADTGNQDKLYELKAEKIIATDGANSAVRAALANFHENFSYEIAPFQTNYKELTIPAGEDGDFRMEANALHIWGRRDPVGGSYMMIALPNIDKSFTCTLFLPHEGETTFAKIDTEEKLMAWFQREFPDAIPLMPTLVADYFANPVSPLNTVKCFPWVAEDKLALAGDACHAVVPFYGQGMNASFEDCIELMAAIEANPSDWTKAFDAYQQVRKPNADAIAWMAQDNFLEMSERSVHPAYPFRKAVEQHLERNFPHYNSQYELVSFSLTPYKEAMEKGFKNQKILDELTATASKVEEIDLAFAAETIAKYY